MISSYPCQLLFFCNIIQQQQKQVKVLKHLCQQIGGKFKTVFPMPSPFIQHEKIKQT